MGGAPPPQKCAKNSKGPPLRTFCTLSRRGGATPPGFRAKLKKSEEGGEGRGGLGALSRKLPTIATSTAVINLLVKFQVSEAGCILDVVRGRLGQDRREGGAAGAAPPSELSQSAEKFRAAVFWLCRVEPRR